MHQSEIIRMAKAAGIFTPDGACVTVTLDMVSRFAELVAVAKRRECARAAQDYLTSIGQYDLGRSVGSSIRART